MPDNTAKIEMTAESEAVVRALQKVERGFDKVTDKVDRLERTTRKSARANSDMLAGAVKGATAFAGALGIVTSGIGVITAAAAQFRREYENLKSRQKDASTEGLSFESALADAVRNKPEFMSPQDIERLAIRMSKRTGMTPAKAASAVGAALASTGVQNRADAELAVAGAGAALLYAPDMSQEDIEETAGVGASMAKKFGVRPSAAIGLVQRVGQQSNVRKIPKLVSSIAPAISNMTNMGFDIAEAGSLAATMTQGLMDTEGDNSATAVMAFGASLNKAFPGMKPMDAMRRLMEDREAFEAFFRGGKIDGRKVSAAVIGKGKARPTMEAMMTPGTVEHRQFTEGIGAIGGFRQGQDTFDQMIDDVRSVTPLSQFQRVFTSSASQMRVADKKGAATSIAREGLVSVLKAAGASDAAQRWAQLAFETEAGLQEQMPVQAVIDAMEARARSLRRDRQQFTGGDIESGMATTRTVPASKADIRQAEVLSDIARTLTGIYEDQRRRDPPAQRRQPAAEALGRRD